MNRIALVAAFLLVAVTPALAQKIGYCNFQALVARHPDTPSAQQQLQTHEQKLQQRLEVKQNYAQGKLQEYQELAGAKSLTPEQDAAKRKELEKLDEELRNESTDARSSLQRKQEELLQPIIEKVRAGVEALAKEEGYTYIINDGPKGTVVLVGPASDDVTEKAAKRLNISLVDPKPAVAPGTPAPTPAPKPAGTAAPKPTGAPK